MTKNKYIPYNTYENPDDLIGSLARFALKITRVLYPSSKVESGEYAIFVAHAHLLEGEAPGDSFPYVSTYTREIVFKGQVPALEKDIEYIAVGRLIKDKRYGYQYELLDIHTNFVLEGEVNQRIFFETFLSPVVIDNLFKANPNPVQLLENEDVAALCKVKGIGHKTASRIIQRYWDNKDNSYAYVELAPYGLTKEAIGRLIKTYGSADIAVCKIKTNPYLLIKEVRGYGWKKADSLAQKNGMSPLCKERVQAYVHYLLDSVASAEGHTWVIIDDLMAGIAEVIEGITPDLMYQYLKEMMDEKELFYQKEGRRVSLTYFRKLEEKIATRLIQLKNVPVSPLEGVDICIENSEKELGFSFTDEQRRGIKALLQSKVSLVVGLAGCVDADTEYFNGTEWKRIADYTEGDKVLQYNEDGSASLVLPQRYIKAPCDELWYVRSVGGVDMCLSDEHEVYYKNEQGALAHTPLSQIRKWHQKAIYGFSGEFIPFFFYSRDGISKTDCEIIDTVRAVLEGKTDFPREFYNCSRAQQSLIMKYLLDVQCNLAVFKGSKQNADFVQFLFASNGTKAMERIITTNEVAVMLESKSEGKLIAHICATRPDAKDRPHFVPYKTRDGYKYCFTVNSHMWVMRRNGCILVTGNSGKTSIMHPVVRALERNGLDFAQCALSGKASLNLYNVTGAEGQTIHRLLGYDGFRYRYNKYNPLPHNVIILDELSMVGGELFLQLLEALPETARLIMIGDPGQLEAIGLCNLIKDIENSGTIPIIRLTKIHRQAAKSGIISNSLKIYEKQQFIPRSFAGSATLGELQDFTVHSAEGTMQVTDGAVEEFLRLHLKEHIPLEDLVIITAKRAIGESSARAINEQIHAHISNFKSAHASHRYQDGSVYYSVDYHCGDRVLVTVNLKTSDINGDFCPVYNGNLGTIKSITTDGTKILIDFPQGEVLFTASMLEYLQLGYAITCHKLQGSGIPYVVVAVDPSAAYSILSKEWLYTAITRAKKHCYLIGPTSTIHFAVNTTRVQKKQTWLTELLIWTQDKWEFEHGNEKH